MAMQQSNSSITHTTYQATPDITLSQEPKALTVVLMDTTVGHSASLSFDGTNDAVVLSGGILQSYKFEHRLVGLTKIWLKASNTANVQVIAEQ